MGWWAGGRLVLVSLLLGAAALSGTYAQTTGATTGTGTTTATTNVFTTGTEPTTATTATPPTTTATTATALFTTGTEATTTATTGTSATTATTGSTTGCPIGYEGCPCENGVGGFCARGLMCDTDGTCYYPSATTGGSVTVTTGAPTCVNGSLGCPCTRLGFCEHNLTCVSSMCLVPTTGTTGGTTGSILPLGVSVLVPCATFAQCLRVAFTASATGVYAAEGQAVRDGYILWASATNEAGGLRLPDRISAQFNVTVATGIELVYADDGSSAATVSALYQTFASGDSAAMSPAADALLAPFGTELTDAAALAINTTAFNLIGSPAGASVFTKGYRRLFGVARTTRHFTQDAVALLAASGAASVRIAHASRAALGFIDDMVQITETAVSLTQGLALQGTNIAYPTSVNWGNTSDTTATSALRATVRELAKPASPDVLFSFQSRFSEASAVIEALAAEDVEPHALFLNSAPVNDAWVAEAGLAADWLLGPTQWRRTVNLASYSGDAIFTNAGGWASQFESFFSSATANQLAAGASAAGRVLANAFENAAAATTYASWVDQTQLTIALRATNMTTLYGPVKFDSRGENIAKAILTTQVQPTNELRTDRTIEIVAPAFLKTANLIYPAPINEPFKLPENIDQCATFTIGGTDNDVCTRTYVDTTTCDIVIETQLNDVVLGENARISLETFTGDGGFTGDSNCNDLMLQCDTCVHWKNVSITAGAVKACASQEFRCFGVAVSETQLGCFENEGAYSECLANCPSNCNSRGTCVDGRCECNPGWSGLSCRTATCTSDCGGSLRGTCVDGKCVCTEEFSGDSCETFSKSADADSDSGGGLPGWATAIIVIIVVLVVGLIGFYVYKKRQDSKNLARAQEFRLRQDAHADKTMSETELSSDSYVSSDLSV